MTLNFSGNRKSTSILVGIIVLLAGSLAGGFTLLRTQAPVVFEASPRLVTSGSDPSITVRDTGDIYLLKAEKGNLWYERSMDGGDTFGHPVRANDVEGEVMPHAEATPRLYLKGGNPYALWQAHAGGDSDRMKLRFARSTDYGESFKNAIDVDPTSPASQSFFTMSVSHHGTIFVAWLDGREKGGIRGGAAVYLARSTDGGATFEKSVRVVLNSCPCCRPSIAFGDHTANTVYVGFRELFDGDVRDMAVATSTDGGKNWGNPVRVALDNWQINGCPHSGPSLAVLGNRLYVSWFTVHEKDQQSYIFLAHSDDMGKSFTGQQSLSDGTLDANHPYLVPAKDKLFAVFQARDPQSNGGWGKIHAYVREVSADGRLSRLVSVGSLGASASYPTMAFESPGHVYLAWAESAESNSNVVFARGRLATTLGLGGIHAE